MTVLERVGVLRRRKDLIHAIYPEFGGGTQGQRGCGKGAKKKNSYSKKFMNSIFLFK